MEEKKGRVQAVNLVEYLLQVGRELSAVLF